MELEAAQRLHAAGEIELVDVREDDERAREAIPGSLHLPFRLVAEAADDGMRTGKPIVTICESGARAAIAASVLVAGGIDARPIIHGGVGSWHVVPVER
jgi:rhodanese-related sulfurtransferase